MAHPDICPVALQAIGTNRQLLCGNL